ncbi:hypothetical protein [Nodosilinea sp. P-1105]|nr:hypothetical protein [Nodosilinea sp. P-1105]
MPSVGYKYSARLSALLPRSRFQTFAPTPHTAHGGLAPPQPLTCA